MPFKKVEVTLKLLKPPPRKIITSICCSPLDALELLYSQYFHISENSVDIQGGQSYTHPVYINNYYLTYLYLLYKYINEKSMDG